MKPTTTSSSRPLKIKLLNKARFDKMTVYQRRVAICRDTILRLKIKNLAPIFGATVDTDFNWEMTPAQVQCQINNATASDPCEGCAKGLLLFTWVGQFDSMGPDLRWASTSCPTSIPSPLRALFGTRLFDAIEVAYEHTTYQWIKMDHRLADAIIEAFPLPDGHSDKHDLSDRQRVAHIVRILTHIVRAKGVMRVKVGGKVVVIGEVA